jgi:alkylation response protein AidB-like acyl-CoA dehydrogenase
MDGDHFVINGQKVWTSHADKSDWIFCLVRTAPDAKKQEGISFVIFDMRTPGVSVRPIQLISGASPFCETFLTDVRVPADQMVGPLHQGWTVAKSLLRHERTMVGEALAGGGSRPAVLQGYTLSAHAKVHVGMEGDRLADAVLRDDIARNEMDYALFQHTLKRIRDKTISGESPGLESSIVKVFGTEMNQRRWDLAMRISGNEGLGWEAEGFSEKEIAITRQWLRSRGNSIEGGTSEIQRNIIATRVLGLPRGPR